MVFEGRTVKDAAASSFESLGRGYAKDAWRVYYRGEAIPGVSPGSFRMPRR
ncbi:DKNYY domain-containing protein [Alistipes senegalensis]|uniref:DKNYY domain-containing protein n=1 Tax=Alistipes senegalensis TaxID=1288121 RepID=UPI002A777385|nr:DKNYY domain-containing protein [Alistipes senegalensis]MDY5241948.1 DKNYY domain-containing protein [Alistipes senegalensis]